MATSFHSHPSSTGDHNVHDDDIGRQIASGSGVGRLVGPHGLLQRDAVAALDGGFDPALGSYPSYSNSNSHPSPSPYSNSIAPLLHAASTQYNSTNGDGSGEMMGKSMGTNGDGDVGLRRGNGSRSASGGDEEDNDQDNEHDHGEGEGGRPLKNTKRAAQNRAAQRAFRERKEQYVRDLERKSAMLDETVARERELQNRLAAYEQGLVPPPITGAEGISFPSPFTASSADQNDTKNSTTPVASTSSSQDRDRDRDRILELEKEVAKLEHCLASEKVSHTSTKDQLSQEKARFELERNGWANERDGWKFRETELRRECDGLRGALGECRRVNGDLMAVGSGRRSASREDASLSEDLEGERKRQRL